MGRKKSANKQHVQQSMGQMVSKAALAQLGAPIEAMVRSLMANLGSQLATQQAQTLENLFARQVAVERLMMSKFGLTTDDLSNIVADVEDEKEGLTKSETVSLGDVTRILIKTKTKDQAEYAGESKIKIYQTGTGQTIGKELEEAILGMKAGETKEVDFGKDKGLLASITLNRTSTPAQKEEAKAEAHDEGVEETTAGTETAEENKDASEAQG